MQLGVGRGVVHGRGNRLVLQAEDRLDQAGDAGCRIQMADVRLHRTQHARAGPVQARDLESLSQGFDFDRITQRGTGSVGLHESDGRGVDTGYGMRFGDDLRLAGEGRCRIGHLDRAVVVDRRAADDGVDAVTVVERCLQRLEYHRRDPAAEDGAVGPDVERSAVARGRHHRPRLVGVANVMRHPDRGGTGQHTGYGQDLPRLARRQDLEADSTLSGGYKPVEVNDEGHEAVPGRPEEVRRPHGRTDYGQLHRLHHLRPGDHRAGADGQER